MSRKSFEGLVALVVAGALLLQPARAEACAIAAVSQTGALGADAQRIFISAHSDHTDVVVQVSVADTTEDYGILIPIPVRPTLDTMPVDARELDGLDQRTQVNIIDNTGLNSDSGGGIGCGAAADRATPGSFQNSTEVVQTAQIGPLTAVVLTASTGTDLTSWLSNNGYVVPAGKQALIDRYSLPGQYFIAAKRTSPAQIGEESSLGLHFTLPGVQLGIPLPIAQLGGAEQVAFTVFVAADQGMGPTGPYARLKIEDLNKETVRVSRYRAAIDQAVSAKNGRAFVTEGVYEASVVEGRIASFTTAGQKISRLSSVTTPGSLTENLMLGPTNDTNPPSSYLDVTAEDEESSGCRSAGGLASPLAYLAIIFAIMRRAKRRA
jgi:hypothetical protein